MVFDLDFIITKICVQRINVQFNEQVCMCVCVYVQAKFISFQFNFSAVTLLLLCLSYMVMDILYVIQCYHSNISLYSGCRSLITKAIVFCFTFCTVIGGWLVRLPN